jgi:hypothetical protein
MTSEKYQEGSFLFICFILYCLVLFCFGLFYLLHLISLYLHVLIFTVDVSVLHVHHNTKLYDGNCDYNYNYNYD